MPQMEERVRQLFGESIEAKISVADSVASGIADAGSRLVQCLLNDGRIFVCGGGVSAFAAQYFASLLVNRFESERPPLPVISLCSDYGILSAFTGDGHADQVFARSLQALGQPSDVLLALSTSASADAVLNAMTAASARGMDTILLTGRDGGLLASHLGPGDIELRIPLDCGPRIREVHLFVLHCFCDVIEQSLFGQLLG
ncbi:DnaA initiator-associating factor for replication initiation [Legionella geestiana]|uniref:DnaA initiator-associating factor for replication initiation n=1 Tax=Legionella geestiana TaxID=45065 RepID=A0A0W0TNN7_9GAMM|nr:SIS domain-containing protein [Legionella geestiana]KTC97195.1 DnaA initiator-associating factor for replication initiation [Legionella geestiana]QBS12331.1 SIS domain-containing protein [Legionella geestiana]STX55234.1 DnaA initiator-associating factor for replication initiation [Legionella geestiana]